MFFIHGFLHPGLYYYTMCGGRFQTIYEAQKRLHAHTRQKPLPLLSFAVSAAFIKNPSAI